MKICIDNELEEYRKVVSIVEPEKEKITDYFSVFIDSLRVLGFNQEQIELGLLYKCYEYNLIDKIDETEEDEFGDESEDYNG